jgi:hypothetical protein
LVIALALVVALVAITPTLGSSRQSLLDRSTFPVRTAKKAKEIAKQAKKIANEALTAANAANATASSAVDTANGAKSDAAAAQSTANGAVNTANAAKSTADATGAELAGLRAKSDSEAPTDSTTEQNTYVILPTGATTSEPNVTVTVPASGLIEVWAQATITDGAVSLYEDGQKMPNQDPSDNCFDFSAGPPPPEQPLLAAIGGPSIALSTPGDVNVAGFCGNTSAPSPILFKTSSGPHTYELRYASCGCSPQADFTDRMLVVAPRP